MPKIIDHDSYRKELLSKCFDIFAAKGYATLTMRELATELKVSTGTLYHYWSGKEEIFEALVTYQSDQDRSKFMQSIGEPKTLKERIEVLVAFVSRNEEYFLKQFFVGIDYYRHKGDEAMVQNQVMKRSNELCRDSLVEFLGIEDPEIITFVLSAITGTIVGRMYEGPLVSMERQGRMLAELLRLYLQDKAGGREDAQ